MAKILLLDDSPVMHRVVRLTFADDAGVEISVARTPPEAELALSTAQPELVIAYARFPGAVDLAYFHALRNQCPLILLLAESEENLDHFVAAGFNSILRKPFHSDELRLAVEGLLSGAPEMSRPAVIAGRAAPTPPSSMTPPSSAPKINPVAPAAPSSKPPSAPPTSKAPAAAPVAKPATPPPPPSIPPITPVPMESASATIQASSRPPAPLDEPQITMNLSFFKKPSAPSQESGAAAFDVAEPPAQRKADFEAPVSPPPRPAAAATHQQSRIIEPAPWSSEPLSLEDVMVSTRVGNSGMSRHEVEKIVEDAVASAVSNAVRQALNETLPDLRQALVNEVSQRAVAQLSAELQSIKISLRENMLSEIRDLSAQWLRRETPNLAKDVIREEIRKVIEQI
jgi:CheY-like chemotaxis protein